MIDCDVIQADGGTRTASITGAFVALYDAIQKLLISGVINQNPIKYFVAGISVGVVAENLLLDLDYIEDSNCDSDMNIIMHENLGIIEIQGTAEGDNGVMNRVTFNKLLDLAEIGINKLIKLQKQSLHIE